VIEGSKSECYRLKVPCYATEPVGSVETYHPTTGTFSVTAGVARAGHTTNRLPGGEMLVAGGEVVVEKSGFGCIAIETCIEFHYFEDEPTNETTLIP